PRLFVHTHLLPVARFQLLEQFGLVAVPLTQLFRRRDVLEPGAHPRVVFAYSPRPDAVDEEPAAVIGACIGVDPRHPHGLRGAHLPKIAPAESRAPHQWPCVSLDSRRSAAVSGGSSEPAGCPTQGELSVN